MSLELTIYDPDDVVPATRNPTRRPTRRPTDRPTRRPTRRPTNRPTNVRYVTTVHPLKVRLTNLPSGNGYGKLIEVRDSIERAVADVLEDNLSSSSSSGLGVVVEVTDVRFGGFSMPCDSWKRSSVNLRVTTKSLVDVDDFALSLVGGPAHH